MTRDKYLTLLKTTLLHGCFSRCTNGTKLLKIPKKYTKTDILLTAFLNKLELGN